MKRIRLIIRQADIARSFPQGISLELADEASSLDAIEAADHAILTRCGRFPVEGYESLVEMVWHPHERRFYNQVAVQAYSKDNAFLHVRESPEASIPEGATVVLVPEGGCSTDWEKPVRNSWE